MTLIEKVQELLLQEWDPIGIVAMEGPTDEYDSYAAELVQSGETRTGEIAQYLAEIRFAWMSLGAFPIQQNEWDVAEKLAAVLKDV